ncbi:hypothetical protein OQA88_1119 [Cercophora sp. LCS_1]
MSLPALLTSLCLFAGRSAAELRYRYPNAACTNETVPGEAVVCCSGDCLDGTTIFDQTGLCQNVLNECLDPGTPLSCSSNQVFTLTASESVDAGLGLCYLPITGCIWSYTSYTYSCCDCPTGFVPVASACTDRSRPFSDLCVGCSQPDEQIEFNAVTQAFACNGPSLVCRTARAASTAASALGLMTTWAGALCATTDLKSLALSLLQGADAVMAAIVNPSNGVLGTKFNAASAVITGVNALALGAAVIAGASVEVPLAVALPLLYVQACNIVGTAGAGLFVGGAIAEALQKLNCPPTTPKKRSVSLDPELAVRAPARRDGLSNPCAEFVAMFPADSSSVAAADSACNDVASYDVASITDAAVADAISTLQQVCASLQDSNQISFMRDLVNLLSALDAAIPYCDVDTPSSSLTAVTSALPSDSGIPSSIPSSSSVAVSSAPASNSGISSNIPSSISVTVSSEPPSNSASTSSAAPSSASQSNGAPQPSASQVLSSSFSAAVPSSTTLASFTSTVLPSQSPQSTTSRAGGCHRKVELRKRRQHQI